MTPIFNLLIALAIASTATLYSQTQQTVFKAKVFNATTSPGASSPLPNIGQAVHVMSIFFPTAVADVTGIVFRTEASFDNVTYFPISEDITTATYNSGYGYAYAISRSNGSYPYVRLRYVTADAGNRPLTANYTGGIQPIGIVRLSNQRYIADSPLAGTIKEWPGETVSGVYYVQGRRMTPINPADWPINVNFAAQTTRTDDPNSINLIDAPAAAVGWKLACRSLPAAPYTIRLHTLADTQYSSGDGTNRVGAVLRNSTSGNLISYANGSVSGQQTNIAKWTSPTSGKTDYVDFTNRTTQAVTSWQISDDLTNRRWFFWNGKRTSSPFTLNNVFWGTSVPRNDFTLPDQICFGIYHDNTNYATIGNLVGYDVNPTW